LDIYQLTFKDSCKNDLFKKAKGLALFHDWFLEAALISNKPQGLLWPNGQSIWLGI